MDMVVSPFQILMLFKNLVTKSDAKYEIAFKLFDIDRTGIVEPEDFRRL